MDQERKVVLFIAPSLDGYIATQDESLEWLFRVEGKGDNGYSAFYETVDTILMGKRTYDWILKHVTDGFPYANKECYVLTRSALQETEHVQFINEDLHHFVRKLKRKNGKNIWVVGGGELLRSMLEEKLVDKLIITIAPTLLGNGIPLFPKGNYQFHLQLKNVQRFRQFVELQYEVKKAFAP